MGSAIAWFMGSVIFLILVVVFGGMMGQDRAELDLGDMSTNVNNVNASGEFSASDSVSFAKGFIVTWSDAPQIVSVLLLLPLIIIGLSGWIMIFGGN